MVTDAPSTVSYVLTGKRSISPATQRRVQAAIDELGFMPHAGARTLRASRTNVLALSEPALASATYHAEVGQFIYHLSRAAHKHVEYSGGIGESDQEHQHRRDPHQTSTAVDHASRR